MRAIHRNGFVDILRFVFSIMIVLFHAMSLEGVQDSMFKSVVARGGVHRS